MDGIVTTLDFELRGEHIPLAALLKASGLAPSGGAVKTMLANGQVQVNGSAESRRGRKLRAGDEIAVGAHRVRVRAP